MLVLNALCYGWKQRTSNKHEHINNFMSSFGKGKVENSKTH